MAGLNHEFLSSIRKSGVSKTSHFEVSIPFVPAAVNVEGAIEASRLLSFRCESTELPGRQLVTQENKIYGPVYKTPYQSIYQDITLNFIETSDLYIRQFFELWMDIIFRSTDNRLQYPDSYRTRINITQYDLSVKNPGDSSLAPIAAWTLYSAFPSAINQMPVSWTEDGFHRVSVTLAYEYYIISTPTTQPKQIKPSAPTSKRTQGSARK